MMDPRALLELVIALLSLFGPIEAPDFAPGVDLTGTQVYAEEYVRFVEAGPFPVGSAETPEEWAQCWAERQLLTEDPQYWTDAAVDLYQAEWSGVC